MIHPVFLLTDIFLYLLIAAIGCFTIWSTRHEHLRAPWRRVFRSRFGVIAFLILMVYVLVGLLDSIHFKSVANQKINNIRQDHNLSQVKSLLDILLEPLGEQDEKTYSAPFASHLYSKEIVENSQGVLVHDYPRLKYGGNHLLNTSPNKFSGIVNSVVIVAAKSLGLWLFICGIWIRVLAKGQKSYLSTLRDVVSGNTFIPWRIIYLTLGFIITLIWISKSLSVGYHIFGTDKVGHDVFYQTIKSIRTGLIIGTLTTLVMLPFAVSLGTIAGYFQGRVDDIIQYFYTTLSSIPAVLLIAAAILSLQVFITNHPDVFNTLMVRADVRLFALCEILGVTSWTSLCRLLRAEISPRIYHTLANSVSIIVGKSR